MKEQIVFLVPVSVDAVIASTRIDSKFAENFNEKRVQKFAERIVELQENISINTKPTEEIFATEFHRNKKSLNEGEKVCYT